MSIAPPCAVPDCKLPVANLRHRLCLPHYNRAKDRRRNSGGKLSWNTLIANPELLNGKHVHLDATARTTADPRSEANARTCIACSHFVTVPPLRAFACEQNQFGAGFRFLSIEQVERGGIPSHLVGRARTCPFFFSKP